MSIRSGDVSLVISVWNRCDDLRENLQAIRKQTVAAREVIVVDNASTDGTPEMVAEEFPEVRLPTDPRQKTLKLQKKLFSFHKTLPIV